MDSGSGGVRRARREQQNQREVEEEEEEYKTEGEDLISSLPNECTQSIFEFLPSARDRCACAAVCKKWLVLLAHMRGCEFNSFRLASRSLGLSHRTAGDDHGNDDANRGASRCLEAEEANDARLAAMAVGTYARRLLGRLSVRGGRYPDSPAQQRVTDFGLHIVSHSFPNLRCLTLWDCSKVGSSGLASIAECCRALEKLDISNSPRIDDDGLVPIAKNCPKLCALSLESCPLVGNRTLEALGECSSHLEFVSIARCPQVGDVGIASLVSHLPNLTRVRLAHLKLGNASLEAIGRHHGSVRVLSLENLAGLTMEGFSWIRLADKLEVLKMSACEGLTDAADLWHGASSMAPAFQALRQVCIRRCGCLRDEGLLGLASSTHHLEVLRIERCDLVTSAGVMEAARSCGGTLRDLWLVKCRGVGGDEEKEGGGPYPTLESLVVRSCERVGDGFLARVAPMCSRVSHVELVGLEAVTDRGVYSLLRWVSPRTVGAARVNLSGCVGITDWSVLNLARAFGGRLESLGLEGCGRVGDRGIAVVGEACSGLKDLDVSRTAVGDMGVESIATAPHQRLEVLSLGGCAGVTDRAVRCVQVMCGGLVGLNLQSCDGVSPQALRSLMSTLWWCDLLY